MVENKQLQGGFVKNSWSALWAKLLGKETITTSKQVHIVELPDGSKAEITRTADCIGASCPRPQLVTMHTLEEMHDGEILELVSDNPTTVETIPALAMVLFCKHLATIHDDKGWRIYIQKDNKQEAQPKETSSSNIEE